MTTSAADAEAWERILELWNTTRVPEGEFLLQVTAEGVTMSPAPGGPHIQALVMLTAMFEPVVNEAYYAVHHLEVAVRSEPGIFIPDMALIRPGEIVSPMDSAVVMLVAEVTSPSNAENDRTKKCRAYAVGGIPQYLLIDPLSDAGPTVTLFTQPDAGRYTKSVQVPYGDLLVVEHPVPVTIDTGRFPLPTSDR